MPTKKVNIPVPAHILLIVYIYICGKLAPLKPLTNVFNERGGAKPLLKMFVKLLLKLL